jgi:acetyl-CoA synthetase
MVANPLDEASDNNTAEIMDAEDPLFILYTSTWKTQGNGAYYSRIYGVHSLYFKKMYLIMKTTIFSGVPDIGWITGHSYILTVLY